MYKKGFSLVEVIIVIAIIGIMTGLVIISLSPAKISSKLDAAGREVASVIKLAQSYSLQGKTVDIAGLNKTPCGFGVYFFDANAGDYEVFFLNDDDCDSFNKDGNALRSAIAGRDVLEKYSLKEGIEFNENLKNKAVYFTVPHGNILNENGDIFPGTIINLKYSDVDSKDLIINAGGSVQEN